MAFLALDSQHGKTYAIFISSTFHSTTDYDRLFAEWLDGRKQRQVDRTATFQAEVAQRLEELHELREKWGKEMLEEALTSARQLLCELLRRVPSPTYLVCDRRAWKRFG